MDGLSPTSSVFAVVSLGLSVRQGLATYSTYLKSSNEETENINFKIQGLENVLNAVSLRCDHLRHFQFFVGIQFGQENDLKS